MISHSALPMIRASVPVLRQHGVSITKAFYSRLFAAHPELSNVFNMGNQANGSQQGSLAAALFAYAANIEDPDALTPVIERIAHKHASIGIRPSHYPIVARHLLGAIRSVLGDAATPELLTAWDEAYWLLAGELIANEARLYERAASVAGDLRALRITQVVQESAEIVSIYLQTSEGGSPGSFEPGQFVSVAIDLPEMGSRQLRQYSLSDSPRRPYWRITIKREPKGAAKPAGWVSNRLHVEARPGEILQVSAPFGNFAPAVMDRPLVLLSAGVGITPMISALNTLADSGSQHPILFAHATRALDAKVLGHEVQSAATRLPSLQPIFFYEDASADPAGPASCAGRMVLSEELLAPYRAAEFYLCGPLPFMREQWRSLVQLGIPAERLHREVFGPELLDHLQ